MKILIVDDSPGQRALLRELFAPHGHCTEAEDGAAALELFGQALEAGAPFTLVVLDVLMPGLDGHATLARLKDLEHRHNVSPECSARCIMVSCLQTTASIMRAQYEAGADAYLVKPVHAELVEELLRSLDLAPNPLLDGVPEDADVPA
ncbi:MAG: response regulator [Desulfovibrio sp.]|nr:response regulator [Desulfovibrio sp.]MCA1985746.1 response regulator [Desulfovibrio sp.]